MHPCSQLHYSQHLARGKKQPGIHPQTNGYTNAGRFTCDSTSPRLKKEGATRWVDLEDTVLSAISPTPKEKPWVIPLTADPTETERGPGVPGAGGGELLLQGAEFQFGKKTDGDGSW